MKGADLDDAARNLITNAGYGAFFIVLFNTLVDVAYAFLDPRIRLGEAAPV